jgi:hypothetical protein
MQGFTLLAQCRDTTGALHTTSLNLLDCGQPAAAGNVNGVLICESGDRRQPVPGSWAGSCANERLAGSTLAALRLNGAGTKIQAAINLSNCAQPMAVTNVNGQLVCAGGAGQTTSRFTTLNLATPDLPAPNSRVIILQTDQPANSGTTSSAVPVGFAGTWSIRPNSGKSFLLTLRDAGSSITGDADLESTHIRFSGTPVGAHLDAVWQIDGDHGPITGSAKFDLSPDRSQLTGLLQVTGGSGQADLWSGVRQADIAAGLPVPVPVNTNTTAAIAAAGFVVAIVSRSVSVRSRPTMNGSTVLRSLVQGTQVQVQCDKSWCALSTGDGFVSKGFLSLQAAASPPSNLAPSAGTAMLSNGTTVNLGAAQNPVVQLPGGPAAMLGCNQRATVKSNGNGGPGQVTLTFHNGTTNVRRLVWVNYDGGDVSYGDVAPGASLTQQTFEGHVWELTDDQGRCTLLFAAGNANQTLELH